VTHPDALSDTAIALFRSWMIEHFGPRKPGEKPSLGEQSLPGEQSAMRLAVSND
jgi:hypothetical protein